MIRADTPLAAPTMPPLVPDWAVPHGPVAGDADAAFLAGAALHALDFSVRSEPVWAGAWRQRLALKSAAASVRFVGRTEDEQALRDAWHLRSTGGNPGPAGNILAAWRHLVSTHLVSQLASRPPAIDADGLANVVELLGLRWSDDFLAIPDHIDALTRSAAKRPAPFAAAAIAERIFAARPDAEVLGWWLADFLLAQRLRWPKPVPLLMAQVFTPAFRAEGARGAGVRIRPGEEGFERAVCVALAQGASETCRLAGDIARRAERLIAVAPKLRAKGAGDVVKRLLDDDAVPGSLATKNLSRFAARRLFGRLQQFEAVRELSGRSSFRLYGL